MFPSALGPAQRVRQALWLGAKPPFAAQACLALLQAAAVLGALAALAAVFPPLLERARDVRNAYSQALDQVLPRTPGGTLSELGLPAGRDAVRREHRLTVELLFAQETRATLQKRHDRWQSRFGDAAYRDVLKPLAAERAGRAYLESFLSGRTLSPAAWARTLSPEELERMTIAAETDAFHALKLNPAAPLYEPSSGE